MDLGIGLPNAVPGTTGRQLTDFARAADEAGFSTLGTVDRVVYDSYEPIAALAAAAAVTERIRLATTVLLAPLRFSPALIAKQVLSLDALAGGGRTTLGIALGGRDDDYEISERPTSGRGDWLDDALEKILAIWRGEGELGAEVGPRSSDGGPTLIVGGYVQASFERAAKYAAGWIQGGSGPDQFAEDSANVDEAWKKAGRDGKPRKLALAYYALGFDADEDARRNLTGYYAYMGEETANEIAAAAATDPDQVKAALQAFESNGCDELILFPCTSDPEQVTLLAEAADL